MIGGLTAGPVCAQEPPAQDNSPVQRDELGSLPKRGLTAGTLRISPDGRHFAGVIVRGEKWTVYVDGVESPEYDAVTEDSIHFSADSKRVAYGAMRGGKGIVVVDGKEYPAGLACAIGFPIFNATGEHFLYVAAHPENKASVIVDGKEGETWEALMKGGPVFSRTAITSSMSPRTAREGVSCSMASPARSTKTSFRPLSVLTENTSPTWR